MKTGLESMMKGLELVMKGTERTINETVKSMSKEDALKFQTELNNSNIHEKIMSSKKDIKDLHNFFKNIK